jgi:GNAT acetyltransferase-like protein
LHSGAKRSTQLSRTSAAGATEESSINLNSTFTISDGIDLNREFEVHAALLHPHPPVELSPPVRGVPPVSIQTMETPEAIRRQGALWAQWPGTRDSDLDFFLYIAGIRPEVLRPHVIVAYRENIPDAMLIGRVEQRRALVKFGYLRLPSPRIRVLNFVYGALRGNAGPENASRLVAEVLGSLHRGDADMAVFEHVPARSHLYRAVLQLPGILERGILPELRIHHRLRLPEHSEALYKMLSPKHRQNYRRKGRKLLADFSGDVQVRCYRQFSDAVFAEVESIARKSYQRGLGSGFQDTPEMRGRWELAATKGWLRVHVLYVGGKPCAYWVATALAGTLWGEYIGYDPAYASYSPGMYLLLKSIADLCDRKEDEDIAEVDFGLGDAEYKAILSNHSFRESSISIYGRTLRGLGTNFLSTPVSLADRFVRRFLAQRNLLAGMKKVWRNYAAPDLNSSNTRANG